jgi:hypothetical protein
MGSKSKAPEYQAASYDSGLWGSSTTDKSGTRYNPTGWMNNTMQTVGTNLNPTLQSMVNNDFMKDPNFIRYQKQFTKNMNDLYDTSVLSNLANRGLMRSSGLQGATNAFADTLANNEVNLFDNYYNRQANNLSALQNTANNIYNYITGINNGALNTSNAVNQHNMAAWQAEQAANAQLFGSLANAAGNIAGGYFGGKK